MEEEKLIEELKAELDHQVAAIGYENIHKHRICAICLDYVLRETYDEHMKNAHGYETIYINGQPCQ